MTLLKATYKHSILCGIVMQIQLRRLFQFILFVNVELTKVSMGAEEYVLDVNVPYTMNQSCDQLFNWINSSPSQTPEKTDSVWWIDLRGMADAHRENSKPEVENLVDLIDRDLLRLGDVLSKLKQN